MQCFSYLIKGILFCKAGYCLWSMNHLRSWSTKSTFYFYFQCNFGLNFIISCFVHLIKKSLFILCSMCIYLIKPVMLHFIHTKDVIEHGLQNDIVLNYSLEILKDVWFMIWHLYQTLGHYTEAIKYIFRINKC